MSYLHHKHNSSSLGLIQAVVSYLTVAPIVRYDLKMGQSKPLFVDFHSLHIAIRNIVSAI